MEFIILGYVFINILIWLVKFLKYDYLYLIIYVFLFVMVL